VQRQFFLSASQWDPDLVNVRRLELWRADPTIVPHGSGVLVIDDSGDRKDGVKTAMWIIRTGPEGKRDNGVAPSPL
jgi:hypothetical protein